MADGPNDPPAFSARKAYPWTEIFRCFQVALDPRKLLVAALGVLVMSLGWYFLSLAFYSSAPNEKDESSYNNTAMKKRLPGKKPDGSDWTEDDLRAQAAILYQEDLREWRALHDLAGPNGRMRTLPWHEYRGPNPFLVFTTLVSGSAFDIETTFREFLAGTVPVLIEPLKKLLTPLVGLLDPNATFWTRVYCLLCLVWAVAVWAFFGGIITRIAAVQFAGKERIDLKSAVMYVARRYLSYLLSPLVPIGVIAVIVIAMALYGLVALIPGVGDILLYGLLLPLVILGGVAIAVLLVGLIGYPLMYTTVSAEGTDTFDALSRSYNYVFQAIWSYLWYALVAVAYGAVVVLFVVFMASLAVYMGKWAVSQAPFSKSTNRKPDYLFIYAPESFGWKELLLRGSPAEQARTVSIDPDTLRTRVTYTDANPTAAKAYYESLWGVEKIGAGMATFWLVLVFLLMIGFSYSYFWTASTMVYLLMRKKVDETDLDEIYVDDEPTEPPYTPPAPPTGAPTGGSVPGGTSLPVVSPPPVSPPPVSYSPPPVSAPAPTGNSSPGVPTNPVPTSDELKPTDGPAAP